LEHKQEYPLYRPAKVIDVADEDETGKIQVRIIPELKEVPDDLLPWASPRKQSTTGISEEIGRHNVPDQDSVVIVVIYNESWSTIDYLEDGMSISEIYPYAKGIEDLGNIEEKEDFEYPQPRFERTKDGVVKAHDTEQGQLGLYHPSGLYVWINPAGELFVRKFTRVLVSGENVEFEMNDEDGLVRIKTETVEVEADTYQVNDGSDSVVLFSPLEEIIEKLLEHTHTAPSGPTSPAHESNQTPLSTLKPNLRDMESKTITSD